MLLSLFILSMLDGSSSLSHPGLKVIKTFESPSTVDDFLAYPYGAAFNDEGALFIADRNESQILMWDKDGAYKGSFGSQGDGPGEMFFPSMVSTFEDEVWVWDSRQKMHIFKADGTFVESFTTVGIRPWRMTVLNKQQALAGYRSITDQGEVAMAFSLINRDGTHQELHNWKHEGFFSNISGSDGNTVTMKAFLADVDVQRNADGSAWYGFSQENKLRLIDSKGKPVREASYTLPAANPSDDERKLIENISFPTPNGQRISLKSFPGMKVQFNHPKSPYVHFLVKGDRALFVQTPIGAMQGIGCAFSQASWYLMDLKNGKPERTGKYEFPEDSMVFFRDGRIIATIMDPDLEEYRIVELELEGL